MKDLTHWFQYLLWFLFQRKVFWVQTQSHSARLQTKNSTAHLHFFRDITDQKGKDFVELFQSGDVKFDLNFKYSQLHLKFSRQNIYSENNKW